MTSGMRIQAAIAACLMVVASVSSVALRPTKHMADVGTKVNLERMVPKSFADWQLDTNMPVILPSPDVQAKLDAIYNQVLSRTYVDKKGRRVMLSLAYGGDQSDGTRAHRPEVCYPAQGFRLRENKSGTLPLGQIVQPAQLLMAQLGSRNEPIAYWVTVGDEVALTGFQQKAAQLKYGVKGLVPDGILVRISSINGDSAAAQSVHAAFANDLLRSLPLESAARIFGAASAKAAAARS